MPDTTIRVGAQVDAARAGLSTLLRELEKIDRALEQTGAKPIISDRQRQALTDVGRGAQIAGAGIVALGAFAVKGAADLESVRLGLETVFGGAEQAASVFNDLQTAAARTPFEFPQLARGAGNLRAFGIEADQVVPKLLQLGDLSRGQTDEFNRLVNAYGQATANQRLLREELNRFIEAGVPIYERLREVLQQDIGRPVSIQELNDAISDGLLNVSHLDRAMAALTETGGQFAGALDRASESLEGKFSTVVDEFRFAGAEIAEGVLPVVHDVTDQMIELGQALQELSPEQVTRHRGRARRFRRRRRAGHRHCRHRESRSRRHRRRVRARPRSDCRRRRGYRRRRAVCRCRRRCRLVHRGRDRVGATIPGPVRGYRSSRERRQLRGGSRGTNYGACRRHSRPSSCAASATKRKHKAASAKWPSSATGYSSCPTP